MSSTVNHPKPIAGKLPGSGGEPIAAALLMNIVANSSLHSCLSVHRPA